MTFFPYICAIGSVDKLPSCFMYITIYWHVYFNHFFFGLFWTATEHRAEITIGPLHTLPRSHWKDHFSLKYGRATE